MQELQTLNGVRLTNTPMSARECDKLKLGSSVVNDERSEQHTVAEVFAMQLYIHVTMNSRLTADPISGGTSRSSRASDQPRLVNDYDGRVWLGQGIYPTRRDHPLVGQNGYFIVDDEMGLMNFKRLGKDFFMTGDLHRGTENRMLAAGHFAAHRLHNMRMDINRGDYDKSKADVMGFLARLFFDCVIKVTRRDEDEILNNVAFPDAVNSTEAIMAYARWMHAQVPNTVQVNSEERELFDPINPQDLNWVELNEQFARVLDFGVCPHMRMMGPQPEPKDIRTRNLNAAIVNQVATTGDVIAHRAFRDVATAMSRLDPGTPLWAGVLMEAEDDFLGPVGAQLLGDMMASSLEAPPGMGIWRNRWWDEGADLYEVMASA